MAKRNPFTTADMTGLDWQHCQFVIEVTKDWNVSRAAVAAGFSPEYGSKLRSNPAIDAAIRKILQYRLENSHIDAEWVLNEMLDNHVIARQTGNLTASNTALNMVAKHAAVDAYAAEKVEVATDKEVLARLQRARKRLVKKSKPDEEVSFL